MQSISISVECELVLFVCVVVVEVDFEKEEPEMGTVLVEHRHEPLKQTRVLRAHAFEQSYDLTLLLKEIGSQS